VPDESDAQSELRARLEREAARRIVEVLHAPAVRDLEALWRSLLFLLAGVEWPEVRCYVLDVSRAELAADVGGPDAGSLERSRLARALLEPLPGPGEGAPALVVLAEAFGGEARDVALLNRLAMLAHASGIPLLAGAGAGLLGLAGWADPPADYDWPEPDTPAWDAFRRTEAAASVGLVAPRYLVRLPYGEDTDPCETFPVEEAEVAAGDAYLWGNPAFPAAAALARSFLERGWSLSPAPHDLSGLPIHVGAAGTVLAHPVEAVWNADALRRVADRGVIPLAGYRHEARLRVPTLFSTQMGGAPLSAWWSAG
jgi:type VI secretion system protein ImpC